MCRIRSMMRLSRCFPSRYFALRSLTTPTPTTVSSTSSIPPPPPTSTVKPFHEIPGPSELPYVGSIFALIKEKDGYHVFYENLHKQYGDIVRFELLGKKYVSISRADLIKEVYLSNQTAPLRDVLDPWVMYRRKRNIPLGVTMQLSEHEQDEEEWRKYRRPVAKLLRPALVASYVPRVAQVGLDWVKTLHELQSKPIHVGELRLISSAFGFEAITSVLMGKSMGVLGKKTDQIDPSISSFMKSIDRIFRTTNKLMFGEIPLWRIMNTKTLQEHDNAWDEAFRLAREIFLNSKNNRDIRYTNDGIVDFFDIMDEIESNNSTHRQLTDEERILTGMELIMAGVDTTSNAAQWILLSMGKFPDVQEKLATKLQELMGPSGQQVPITDSILQESNLLHYIDEIFRLYPILPTGSRLFSKDIQLNGYTIPAYTTIALNNYVAAKDEKHFQKPSEFDETRGPRKECPFASKTFGAGSRQCNNFSILYSPNIY